MAVSFADCFVWTSALPTHQILGLEDFAARLPSHCLVSACTHLLANRRYFCWSTILPTCALRSLSIVSIPYPGKDGWMQSQKHSVTGGGESHTLRRSNRWFDDLTMGFHWLIRPTPIGHFYELAISGVASPQPTGTVPKSAPYHNMRYGPIPFMTPLSHLSCSYSFL